MLWKSAQSGLTLAFFLLLFRSVLLCLEPRFLLHRFPPRLRSGFGPLSPGERQKQIHLALPVFLAAAVYLLGTALTAGPSRPETFLPVWLPLFVMMIVAQACSSVFDLLAIHIWYPRFLLTPGWEREPRGDWRFYLKTVFRGIAISQSAAALLGVMGWLLLRLPPAA